MYKNMMAAVMTDALDEAVEKAQNAFGRIADSCSDDEQRDIREALKQYRQATDALGTLIEQNLRGRNQKRNSSSGDERTREENTSSNTRTGFDPVDMLSRASRHIDGKTMEAGIEIMSGFVKMIDNMQRKRQDKN